MTTMSEWIRTCCVQNCNINKKQDEKVPLKKIPKDNFRRQRWYRNLKDNIKPSYTQAPFNSLLVCINHFESIFGFRKLKPDAVPTLFTPDEVARGVPNTKDSAVHQSNLNDTTSITVLDSDDEDVKPDVKSKPLFTTCYVPASPPEYILPESDESVPAQLLPSLDPAIDSSCSSVGPESVHSDDNTVDIDTPTPTPNGDCMVSIEEKPINYDNALIVSKPDTKAPVKTVSYLEICPKQPLQRTLIVYTTKLEDMQTFYISPFSNITELNQLIEAESKPKYPRNYTPWKCGPSKYTRMYHVREVIRKVNVMRRRLERISKTKKKCVKQPSLKPTKPAYATSISTQKRRNTNLKDLASHVVEFRGVHTLYMVLHDELNKVTDVYSIEKNVIRSSFKKVNADHIIFRSMVDKPVLTLNYLCWYERYAMLYKLRYSIGLITFATYSFLMVPHPCIKNQCKCCCSQIILENPTSQADMSTQTTTNPIVGKSDKVPAYTDLTDENIWIDRLLKNTSTDPNNLLKRALKHTKFKHDRPSKDTQYSSKQKYSIERYKKHNDQSTRFKIQLLNSNKLEFYDVEEAGELISYCNNTATNVSSLLPIDFKDDEKLVTCCWARREIIRFDFEAKMKDKRTLNFMNRPHLCEFGFCDCCCRNICPSSKQIFLQNTDGLKPGFNLSKINISNLNFPIDEILSNETQLMNDIILDEIQEDINEGEILHSDVSNTNIELPINPEPILIDNTTQNILTTNLPTNPNPHSVGDITQNILNANPSNLQTHSDPSPQSSENVEVASIINNILERFKDVRLTINDKGKVAASLSTAVSNLTTAELKVLSTILTHAQEQIDQLGLRSNENSNNHVILVPPNLQRNPSTTSAGKQRSDMLKTAVSTDTIVSESSSYNCVLNTTAPAFHSTDPDGGIMENNTMVPRIENVFSLNDVGRKRNYENNQPDNTPPDPKISRTLPPLAPLSRLAPLPTLAPRPNLVPRITSIMCNNNAVIKTNINNSNLNRVNVVPRITSLTHNKTATTTNIQKFNLNVAQTPKLAKVPGIVMMPSGVLIPVQCNTVGSQPPVAASPPLAGTFFPPISRIGNKITLQNVTDETVSQIPSPLQNINLNKEATFDKIIFDDSDSDVEDIKIEIVSD